MTTKFDAEKAKAALELALQGQFRWDICDVLRIGRQTWYDWIKRAEAEGAEERDPELHQWLLDLRQAEATAKTEGIMEVRTATDFKSVKGTVWWLERRWPKDLARRLKTELTGEDGGPIATTARVVLLPPLDAEPARDPVGAEPGSPDPVSGQPRG